MPNIIKLHEVNDWIQKVSVDKLEHALELIENKEVYEFNSYCYSNLFVIDFNWGHWTDGRQFASSGNWNFSDKDEFFCYRIITAISRSDRFCEGVLEEHVNNGLLKAVFERLIVLKKG